MPVKEKIGYKGIAIAITIIFLWLLTLIFLLLTPLSVLGFWAIALIILQTHLFTGIFITAHDAMHGTVYPADKQLNNFIGRVCAILFAFNSYDIMYVNHHKHHNQVLTDEDPDFHSSQKFFPWMGSFIRHYVGWKQILLMAIAFNLLMLKINVVNLLLFWVLPSILSTFQLFYFGTFQPHKGAHNNIYKSGTQGKNHLWAFVSCYFFGYHYEHHAHPGIPWWKLYKTKVA